MVLVSLKYSLENIKVVEWPELFKIKSQMNIVHRLVYWIAQIKVVKEFKRYSGIKEQYWGSSTRYMNNHLK